MPVISNSLRRRPQLGQESLTLIVILVTVVIPVTVLFERFLESKEQRPCIKKTKTKTRKETTTRKEMKHEIECF